MVALASPEDRGQLEKYNWSAQFCDGNYYAARRSLGENGKTGLVLMHRQLLGLKKGELGDHADRNRLNNQRYNLRLATFSENGCNRTPSQKPRKLGTKIGVYYLPRLNQSAPWSARVVKHGISYYLGYFETETEAAIVRDEAAKRLHRKFAVLNFPT